MTIKNTFLLLIVLVLFSCVNQQNQGNTEVDAEETFNLGETTTQFLWRAMKYDSTLQDSFNSIFLNEKYIASMSDQEKAAIGYLATFVGNECWWDGEAREDRSNLDCKIITALSLGYQCSDEHLGFLRQWFEGDEIILSELEKSNCPTTPYTATIQDTFDEITINTSGNSITVAYRATSINVRDGKSQSWNETALFKAYEDRLVLISKDRNQNPTENFEVTE